MNQHTKNNDSPRRAFLIMNNSVVCLGGEFIYSIINFASSIIIARALGNEQYGYWSFVFVYLSFFEMFTRFGLNAVLTKHLSQDISSAPHFLGNALLMRTVLTVVALPVAVFSIWFFHYPAMVKLGILLGSTVLFLNLRSIFDTFFRARLDTFKPALWNVARAVLNLSLVIAVSHFRSHLILFILASLVSGLVSLAGIARDTFKVCRVALKPDWKLIKMLAMESVPLIFSGYLTLLYYRVDVFMLSAIDGFKSVGYYSVATRLTEAFGLISSALMVAIFPLLAKAYKENRPDFESLLRKTFRALFLIGFPIAIGGTLCAHDIIEMLFGADFEASGTTFAILVWFTFLGFITTLFVNILIICGKAIVDTWTSLALLCANVAMNWVLIPRFSFNGAAIATVMVEVFGAVIMMIYLVRHPKIKMPIPAKEFLAAVKINVIFLGVILLLKHYVDVHLVLFVALGAGIYGALLFLAGELRLNDIQDYMTSGVRNFMPGTPVNRQKTDL